MAKAKKLNMPSIDVTPNQKVTLMDAPLEPTELMPKGARTDRDVDRNMTAPDAGKGGQQTTLSVLNEGLKTIDSRDMTLGKNRRNVHSMPRIGFGRSRSNKMLDSVQTARAKFGVIPILTDEIKAKLRAEKVK